MPRRGNQIAISAGPSWTDVFQTTAAGGSPGDGLGGLHDVLLSCDSTSSNPLEYQVLDVDGNSRDGSGEVGLLRAGETVRLRAGAVAIERIQMRGSGGAATGGLENLQL